MIRERLEDHLSVLREAAPGQRFAAYHAWRTEHDRSGSFGALGRWALAVLLLLVGLVTLVTPGPGVLFLTLAAALLAQSSLRFAQLLDRAETRVRGLLRRWANRYGK